jgi:hypothetical protein
MYNLCIHSAVPVLLFSIGKIWVKGVLPLTWSLEQCMCYYLIALSIHIVINTKRSHFCFVIHVSLTVSSFKLVANKILHYWLFMLDQSVFYLFTQKKIIFSLSQNLRHVRLIKTQTFYKFNQIYIYKYKYL